jgi:hypothetical protein
MAFLYDLKDFAQGLARGFGLFLFERRDFAGRAIQPADCKTIR